MHAQIKTIETNSAPAAIGPYVQATVFNNLIFVSGQLPVDPKTNNLVVGDITVQTRQVILTKLYLLSSQLS